MKILAIANHKGGTSKTGTTRALGDVLSMAGLRVLMLDLDPQSSLTVSTLPNVIDQPPKFTLADVMGDAQPGKKSLRSVIITVTETLHLAPASLDLAGSELGIYQRRGREGILREALKPISGRYDICLIDCPPNLGLLVVNALAAADSVLIPTQPLPVDISGMVLFIKTLKDIRKDGTNPDLDILGVLVTFYDDRLITHQAAIKGMQESGFPVLPMKVGRSVRVAEAAATGQSIITFDPENPQAKAYTELGKVVQLWLKD